MEFCATSYVLFSATSRSMQCYHDNMFLFDIFTICRNLTSLMILFQGSLFSDKVNHLAGPLLTYSRPLSFYSEQNVSHELKVGITRNKQKLAFCYLLNK